MPSQQTVPAGARCPRFRQFDASLWLQVVMTVGVILVHILLWAALLGESLVDPNPFAIMGMMMFILPFSGVALVCQYFATFYRRATPSSVATAFHFTGGALMLLPIVMELAMSLKYDIAFSFLDSTLLACFAIFVGGMIAGTVNAKWTKRLKRAPSEKGKLTVHSARRSRTRDATFILCSIVVLVIAAKHFKDKMPPVYGENVSASEAPFSVPTNASDICYLERAGFLRFECLTDEDSFVEWVNGGIGSIEAMTSGTKIMELRESHTIYYRYFDPAEKERPEAVTVSNGLIYSFSVEDRGTHAIFDRDTGKMYFNFHSR